METGKTAITLARANNSDLFRGLKHFNENQALEIKKITTGLHSSKICGGFYNVHILFGFTVTLAPH